MPTKPKTTTAIKQAAAKKQFGYTWFGDSELGSERFASLDSIVTDVDISEGELDGKRIEVWERVGVYEVVAANRILKEVK